MIYLANTWTQKGIGLFDTSLTTNLEIALDLSIAQFSLAQAQATLQRSPVLGDELHELLREKFPRSAAFVERIDTLGIRD